MKDADYSVSGQTPASQPEGLGGVWGGGGNTPTDPGNLSPDGGHDWGQIAYAPGGSLNQSLASLTPYERRLVLMNLMRRYRHA